MCGIAGYYNLERQSYVVQQSLLDAMQRTIVHRGPDGFGTWIHADQQLGFAFRRLAIIDLSDNASQPMSDENQDCTIMFNGEIYNHRVLRAELEALGYRYRSNSDTETILYAFQEWGIACLDKFEGMFALAIYDARTREFYLVRDRIGIKPLYFSLQGGVLSFASEIKALWALPWNKKELSTTALYHYLTFMVAPAPYTIFQKVYKLPAGFYAKIDGDDKKLTFCEWYSPLKALSNQEKKEFHDEQFVLENIESLLDQATKKRMMSDVPFGAFLSGGIDSSLNVALMAKYVGQVKTFTVAFSDGPEHDELVWARTVAQHFGTEHHEVIISEKEAFEFYETMVYHLDEPLADCVCIPLYYVSKLAKECGVSVVQIGEGADELFFGYPVYARYKHVYDRWWNVTQKMVPQCARKVAVHLIDPFLKNRVIHREMLNNWAYDRGFFWGGALAFTEHEKKVLLRDVYFSQDSEDDDPIVKNILSTFSQKFDSFHVVDFYKSRLQQSDDAYDFCKKVMYLELKQRIPELLLMRADKMTMAAGVEARVPFLDHKLVEFMLHVPGNLIFKDGITKYLLKTVARKYLPAEIIDRKKVGFGAPTIRWFENGTYFPSYFERAAHRKNQFFSDRDLLFSASPSRRAVQKWVLQNLWALSG